MPPSARRADGLRDFIDVSTQPASSSPITLAVVNARIWTGNPRRPWADALAVRGDRLAAVGSSAEVRKLAGAGARVVDAMGQMVVPGFADSHVDDLPDGFRLASDERRMLDRGRPANFVILDRDLGRVPPEAMREARVSMTVIGGRVVYEHGSAETAASRAASPEAS